MSSLLTNSTAMTALQTLRSVSQILPPRRTGSPPASASPPLRTTRPTGRSRPRCAPTTPRSPLFRLPRSRRRDRRHEYTGLNGDRRRCLALKAKLVAARSRASIAASPGRNRRSRAPEEHGRFGGVQRRKLALGRTPAAGYNATKSVVSSFSRAGGVVASPRSTSASIRSSCTTRSLVWSAPTTTASTTGTFAAAAGIVTVQVGAAPR